MNYYEIFREMKGFSFTDTNGTYFLTKKEFWERKKEHKKEHTICSIKVFNNNSTNVKA